MRRNTSLFVVFLAFTSSLLVSPTSRAQDTVVPAGTLLRCTMSEPDFSSATAQVGDPMLCHLAAVQVFGHNIFPRGAYMGGHLEAEKEPGHFVGKGYLKIVFDRIALPNSEFPLDAKIVAAHGYPVNREGDIKGKGHAKRDVIEWLFPPLWPWKVIMLPARGPRPTLKGEEVLTLRLMEDVTVPKYSATYNSRDWRPPRAQNFAQPQPLPSSLPAREAAPATATASNANYVLSVDPAFVQASLSFAQRDSARLCSQRFGPRSDNAAQLRARRKCDLQRCAAVTAGAVNRQHEPTNTQRANVRCANRCRKLAGDGMQVELHECDRSAHAGACMHAFLEGHTKIFFALPVAMNSMRIFSAICLPH